MRDVTHAPTCRVYSVLSFTTGTKRGTELRVVVLICRFCRDLSLSLPVAAFLDRALPSGHAGALSQRSRWFRARERGGQAFGTAFGVARGALASRTHDRALGHRGVGRCLRSPSEWWWRCGRRRDHRRTRRGAEHFRRGTYVLHGGVLGHASGARPRQPPRRASLLEQHLSHAPQRCSAGDLADQHHGDRGCDLLPGERPVPVFARGSDVLG